MRIAIIGAGIGGLAAAIGLQRAGAQVAVLERSFTPTREGSALTVFGNGFAALDALGVGVEARAASTWTRPGDPGVIAGQRHPDGHWFTQATAAMVNGFGSIHRVALSRILEDAVQPGTIHYGSPVGRLWHDEDGVRLEGLPGPFDLVVGADGLRSTVRPWIGVDPGLRYSGYTAWRGVTAHPVEIDGGGETWGRGERFGIAPLADGRVYWFATASVPRDSYFPDEAAEVRRRYSGWHAPIMALLDATPDAEVYRRDILEVARPLRTFVGRRSVLIGDAAHAMTPNLGQGGGLALEDAVVLADLLAPLAGSDVLADAAEAALAAALERYDTLRRHRTQSIARKARLLGQVGQWRSPLFAGGRNLGLRLMPTWVGNQLFRPITGWRP
jgi:2-polyprenyl-6-methoxyphenol hydroxylase-like FAD-dependent oxidoreductase